MKKYIFLLLFTVFSTYSFAQSLFTINRNQRQNYAGRPLFIKETLSTVNDINGKVVKTGTFAESYYWFDWDNGVKKEIAYNNKQHPCFYHEEQYNSDGLLLSEYGKSILSEYNYVYEYDAEYKSFTCYVIKENIKEKYIHGEYVKENGSYVYYEYTYDNGEVVIVEKITGPGLGENLTQYQRNATIDKPLKIFEYNDGRLDSISSIYGSKSEEHGSVYYENGDSFSYQYIYDANGNLISKETSFDWENNRVIDYVYDNYGNPITRTEFEITNNFGTEYLKPVLQYDYVNFYYSSSEIFEPNLPDMIYNFEESDDKTSLLINDTSTKSKITTDASCWEIAYYVDSFGDYTDKKYLRLKELIEGTFDNSATSNAKLLVQFLIDSPFEMAIKLYEYGKNEVKSFESESNYMIYVKDESGNSYALAGKNNSDRICLDFDNCIKLHSLLVKNDILKFYITYSTDTSYNFTLITDSGYVELYKQLSWNSN